MIVVGRVVCSGKMTSRRVGDGALVALVVVASRVVIASSVVVLFFVVTAFSVLASFSVVVIDSEVIGLGVVGAGVIIFRSGVLAVVIGITTTLLGAALVIDSVT